VTERQDLELKSLCVLEVHIRSACAICEPVGNIMTKLPLSTRDGLENRARPEFRLSFTSCIVIFAKVNF